MSNLPPVEPPEPEFLPENLPVEALPDDLPSPGDIFASTVPEDMRVSGERPVEALPEDDRFDDEEVSQVSLDSLPYDVETMEITVEPPPAPDASLAQTAILEDASTKSARLAHEATYPEAEKCARCGSTDLGSGSLLTYGDRFRPAYYRPSRLSIRRLHSLLRPFRAVTEVQAQVCRECGLLTLQVNPEKLKQVEQQSGENLV